LQSTVVIVDREHKRGAGVGLDSRIAATHGRPPMLRSLVVAALLLGPPSAAMAQEDSGSDDAVEADGLGEDAVEDDEVVFGATAEVERPVVATNRLDATAAGTEVEARGRPSGDESTQDLLYDVPGTRVLQSGVAGSFAGVSLRGAELSHTTVVFGTLPLGGPDTGTFDLDRIPLAALDRVEVFRGGAPIALSDGAIGGVVRIVPRRSTATDSAPVRASESRAGFSLGVGSFGEVVGEGHASVNHPSARSFVVVGARASQGDFPYVDDGGTLFEGSEDDDVVRRRSNADLTEGYALGHAGVALLGGELSAVLFAEDRVGGEPGQAGTYEALARRTTSTLIGVAGWARQVGERNVYELQLGTHLQRNRFDDPLGQIGLAGSDASDDRSVGLFGRARLTVAATEWLDLTGVAIVRHDSVSRHNAGRAEPSSERWMPALAAEAHVHGRIGSVRLELRPSVRLGFTAVSFGAGSLGAGSETAGSEMTELLPTFRIGGLVAPLPWLAFSGSVSSGRRAPSLIELFGDRALLVANPSLRPESSLGGDLGAVAKGHAGALRGTAEARVFYLTLDDLIRYERSTAYTARADNVESGAVVGVEAGLHGEITEHVKLTASATWMTSHDHLDRALPLRPVIQVLARPELHSGAVGSYVSDLLVFAELLHIGSNFADPANTITLPARTWLSAGVRIDAFDDSAYLAFVVRDLLDEGGVDLLGYPLPGRRFMLRAGVDLDM
jgi:iron complex outermembrane receptor protein